MMQKLFGSKKDVPPPQPTLDMSNKEQLREMEKDYKKKLMGEMRELERGVRRKKKKKREIFNKFF